MSTGHLIQRGHLYTCSSHSVCPPGLRALILLGADSPSCAPRRPPAAPRGSWARAGTGAGSGSGHGAGSGLRHSALGAHLGFQGFTDRKWGEAHQHLDPGPPPPSPQYSSIFPENPTPKNPTPQDPLSFTHPQPFLGPLLRDSQLLFQELHLQIPGSSLSILPFPYILLFRSSPFPRALRVSPTPGTNASRVPVPTWRFSPPESLHPSPPLGSNSRVPSLTLPALNSLRPRPHDHTPSPSPGTLPLLPPSL